jgi:hypothetical protein
METTQYSEVVKKVHSMVYNKTAQAMAAKHQLHFMNVTWEDTVCFEVSFFVFCC